MGEPEGLGWWSAVRAALGRTGEIAAIAILLAKSLHLPAALSRNGLESSFGADASVQLSVVLTVLAFLLAGLALGLARWAWGAWRRFPLTVCAAIALILIVQDLIIYWMATGIKAGS
jgi:hypothetical protein